MAKKLCFRLDPLTRTALPAAAFLLLVPALHGCGGGGGGESSPPPTGGPPSSACSALHLGHKLINGTSCGDLRSSPVLRLISDYSSGRAGYCTGTLITPTTVLTAGHCGENVFHPNDRRLRTVALYTDANGNKSEVEVVGVTVHPGLALDGTHINNDLAVMVLERPLALPFVPVLTSSEPAVGDQVVLFGYGKTQLGTPRDESFEAYLAEPLDLRAGFMQLTSITDLHYDADAITGGTAICHGDSGGPLMSVVNGEAVIVGVTSNVLTNGISTHCAPGTTSEWTRLRSPSVLNELLALVPEIETR